MKSVTTLGLLYAAATAGPIVTLPNGLGPGDTYHLMFVTSSGHDAMSPNIGIYDNFVQSQADASAPLAALSLKWLVLGSSPTIDAIDHVAIQGPVFRLDGKRVATGSADLFDGTIENTVSIDPFGNSLTNVVMTGTGKNGKKNLPFGNGSQDVWVGHNPNVGSQWISYSTNRPWGTSSSFYGISAAIQIPLPTPEPGAAVLLAGGLTALGARKFSGRRASIRKL
ncbi:MAG: hypothetical protein NTV70_02615 [Acidobacteria bacterium]|nr:hypothetical protein [Acidobacteriota bacterium]